MKRSFHQFRRKIHSLIDRLEQLSLCLGPLILKEDVIFDQMEAITSRWMNSFSWKKEKEFHLILKVSLPKLGKRQR